MRLLNLIYIPHLGIIDVIEIIIIALLIYKIASYIKGSRAMTLLKGVFILCFAYFIAVMFNFAAIKLIFNAAVSVCIVGVAVAFQPELRRLLEEVGTKKINLKTFLNLLHQDKKTNENSFYSEKIIDELVKASFIMGETKTGALIVLERKIPIPNIIDTGIYINAETTSQLLINIFEKNTPLHDGAVVIKNNKIKAATCYLPLTESKINKKLGTRHRAAMGMVETSDAVVIIVSEETGKVSFASNGKLRTNLNKDSLYRCLRDAKCEGLLTLPNIEKRKFSIKNWDTLMKISSLLISIILWITLINIADPTTTKTFKDIPVTVINQQVLENTNKTYKVLEGETANINITGARSEVESIGSADITINADLSKLSYVYAVPLEIKLSGTANVESEFIGNDTMKLQLEDLVTKEFKYDVQKVGACDDDYYVYDISLNTDSLTINGPSSIVDTIKTVTILTDIADINKTQKVDNTVKIYDLSGNEITDHRITITNKSIRTIANVYKKKTIPLNIYLPYNILGNSIISDYTSTPKEVTIAAPDNILESTNKLNISIPYTKIPEESIKDNKFIQTFDILDYIGENIHITDIDTTFTVTLKLDTYKTKKITISKKQIEPINVAPEYSVSVKDKYIKTFLYIYNNHKKDVKLSNLKLYIDCSGLTEGKYTLPLQIEKNETFALKSGISIEVIIKKIS